MRTKRVAVACVLTSSESLLLEQKERQKRKIGEAKERWRLEREEKLAREALVREQKKTLQQEKDPKQRKSSKQSESSAAVRGLQLAELSSNECGVCIGAYEDDFNSDSETRT